MTIKKTASRCKSLAAETVVAGTGAPSVEMGQLSKQMRGAFLMLTGKWKLEILWLLNQRIHRFGELRNAIPGITQHMLTAQLRELEADGLVSRQIFAEVPPRVEYSITPAAKELEPVIHALLEWCERYSPVKTAPCKNGTL